MNISDTLFTSSPSPDNRLEKEIAVYKLLDSLDIAYTGIDHDEAATIELCKEIEKKLDTEICKNLFLCNSQKTAFYLLLMPGDKKFKTKDLSKQINSARLSFAGAEHMQEHLNITPGSVSVLGLMNDKKKAVKLLIDKDLLKDEYIGCHPCINTSTLKIKLSDIKEKLLPHLGYEATIVDLPVVE